MAFTFLDPSNTTQPVGMQQYPTKWDPVKRVVLSDNPAIAGYNLAGVLKVPTGTPALPAMFAGSNVAASTQPNIAAPPVVTAGPSPVYPVNIPTTPGVSTVTIPKSPNVSAATTSMFGELTTLKDTVTKTLAEFNAQYPEWLAGQQKTTATENAATSGVFDGTQEAKQNALLADYTIKANAANAKSIADVQRLSSHASLASGAPGTSSALERGKFSTIANINAQAAKDSADRALLSNQWLTQLQQTMAGASGARNRLAIGDTILPATVATNSFETILRQLANLSPIEQNNLITGLVSPGGYIGDSFGQLQAAKLQDLSRYVPQAIPNGRDGSSPKVVVNNNPSIADLMKSMQTKYGG